MNNMGSTTLLHPVFNNLEQVIIFLPCAWIQDSSPWIQSLDSGFHSLDFRFHSLDSRFHSLDFTPWIPNSTPQIPDSIPWIRKLVKSRIPGYLTWGKCVRKALGTIMVLTGNTCLFSFSSPSITLYSEEGELPGLS